MKHVRIYLSDWLLFRTANENDMRLSAAICTANISGVADGGWALISPYGDHASPDGSYTQRFSREQAEKVVKTWNSITGTAARVFKNVMHGLGAKFSTPVWEGHPETDKQRWPKEKLLAEITDVRTGNEGLEGRVTWNAAGAVKRAAGALYPSPLWWHWPPSGEPPSVFPELLESVGLVATPNIASVPAWTRNATMNLDSSESTAGVTDPNQHNTANHMDKKRIIEMLGLGADATDEQIETALKGAGTTANALNTANAAKTDLEASLAAETAKLTTANAELTTATARAAELTTANEALLKGVLDIAEKRGAITPAERDGFQARITTANTAADALHELQTRKAMNTLPVEINGNRIDLSTANARADALEAAIAGKMKEGDLTREQAFAKVKADAAFAPLFAAMQDPTRKES
ncbi:MAG: phage protease [Verrucomicrobiae bacterium]